MEEFKVGDLVQVRSWQDLGREFGIDDDDDIWCEHEYFTEEMRRFCDHVYRVSDIRGDTVYLVPVHGDPYYTVTEYRFSRAMLCYPDEELPQIKYTFDAMFGGEE